MGTSNLKLKLKLKAKENTTTITKTSSSTPKCLSSIFHHLACSSNLPHSPSGTRLYYYPNIIQQPQRLIESNGRHDYSKSINNTITITTTTNPDPNPNPNPKTTTTASSYSYSYSCSGTPGLVARLMGLESMPSFDDNREFQPSSYNLRSKSLNSLNPFLLNSDYDSRSHDTPRHRRAQTSTSVLLQDHHLSLNGRLFDPILLHQVQPNYQLGVSTNSPTVVGPNIHHRHHHHHEIERNHHCYYNVNHKYPCSRGSKYATTTTTTSRRSFPSLSNKAGDQFYCKTETMGEKKNNINIRMDNDKETKKNKNKKKDKNDGKTSVLHKKNIIISTTSRPKTLGNKRRIDQKNKPHIDLLFDQTQKSPVSVLDQEEAFHLSSGSSPETDVKSSQPRLMASSVTVQSQRSKEETKPVQGKNKKKKKKKKKKTDRSSSPPRTSGTKNRTAARSTKTEQEFQGFVDLLEAQIYNLSQQYITESDWVDVPTLDHKNVDDLCLDLAHGIFDALLDHLVGDLLH